MRFSEVVDQAIEFLQQRARVSYRALKREFDLDDETLDDLKAEIIDAKRLAIDEDGKVLVWTGKEQGAKSTEPGAKSKEVGGAYLQLPSGAPDSLLPASRTGGERRQLTVMFCDLVDSTALSTRLDPEDLRKVIRRYQDTCTEVIQRFDGYIAQYLGDGLLVYFGYPQAHEDDAARAVRTGLEIIQALQRFSSPSPSQGLPLPTFISLSRRHF